MRKIAIRIDDVCPDMNWKQFSRFEKLLDKYDICPLIGVVPDCKDESLKTDAPREDYEDWLKRRIADGWVVAMHGYDHIYTTRKAGSFPLNDFSEYAGVSYEAQNARIMKGRKMLQDIGVYPEIFMAPGHTFDKNTVKALKENGFKYITDGFGKGPFERDGMIYLPISYRKSSELKAKDGYTTFVVHTATMSDKEFEWYEKLFETSREKFISYSNLMCIGAKHQSTTEYFSEAFKASLKYCLVRL